MFLISSSFSFLFPAPSQLLWPPCHYPQGCSSWFFSASLTHPSQLYAQRSAITKGHYDTWNNLKLGGRYYYSNRSGAIALLREIFLCQSLLTTVFLGPSLSPCFSSSVSGPQATIFGMLAFWLDNENYLTLLSNHFRVFCRITSPSKSPFLFRNEQFQSVTFL